jgi:hypothetical protein
MLELGVEQLIVTVWVLEYVPPAGEKVGVAASACMVTENTVAGELVCPRLSVTVAEKLSTSAVVALLVTTPVDELIE